jgi:hypothetical protein
MANHDMIGEYVTERDAEVSGQHAVLCCAMLCHATLCCAVLC